jgi:hypothetical protein
MTPSDILKKTKELISDPAHWTQGSFSKNAIGEQDSTYSETAVCWCAVGAMMKVTQDLPYDEHHKAFMVLTNATPPEGHERSKQTGWGAAVSYNDDPKRTHEEVMAWFDLAIAAAEKEP